MFKECIGIEIREDLHDVGLQWVRNMSAAHPEYKASTAAITLLCDKEEGFLATHLEKYVKDADGLFSYNRCFHGISRQGSLNGRLTQHLEKCMKHGAVCVTAYPLALNRQLFKRVKVPEHLTPGSHTTRHGETALSVYVY